VGTPSGVACAVIKGKKERAEHHYARI
jgi:hypothetical protein